MSLGGGAGGVGGRKGKGKSGTDTVLIYVALKKINLLNF